MAQLRRACAAGVLGGADTASPVNRVTHSVDMASCAACSRSSSQHHYCNGNPRRCGEVAWEALASAALLREKGWQLDMGSGLLQRAQGSVHEAPAGEVSMEEDAPLQVRALPMGEPKLEGLGALRATGNHWE